MRKYRKLAVHEVIDELTGKPAVTISILDANASIVMFSPDEVAALAKELDRVAARLATRVRPSKLITPAGVKVNNQMVNPFRGL